MNERLKEIERRANKLGWSVKSKLLGNTSSSPRGFWESRMVFYDKDGIWLSSFPLTVFGFQAAEDFLSLREPGPTLDITQGIPATSTKPRCNECPVFNEKISTCLLLHVNIECEYDSMGYPIYIPHKDCKAGTFKFVEVKHE